MDLTTRCPQCGHTFSASLEQLQLRKGYIRCPNCAHIFDGFDAVVSGQQVPDAEHARSPATAPPSARPEPAVSAPTQASVPVASPASRSPAATQPFHMGTPDAAQSIGQDRREPAPSVVRQRRPTNTDAGPTFTISSASAVQDDGGQRFRVGKPHIADDEPSFGLQDTEPGMAPHIGKVRDYVDDQGRTEPAVVSPPVHRRVRQDEHVIRDVSHHGEPRLGHGAVPADDGYATRRPAEYDERRSTRGGHASRADAAHDDAPGFYMEPRDTGHDPAAAVYDTSRYQHVNAIGKWFWRTLVLLGLVLLLSQLVYVYRVQVAAGAPFLRPALESACRSLGCEVPYSRNIAAISIMSSSLRTQPVSGASSGPENERGASQTAPGNMMLQFILRNTSDRPQEWPVIVLSLKDASGALVVRKNLPPDAYLPPGMLPGPFAAGSEINARVPIMLNGQKVNGYQLDKFFD